MNKLVALIRDNKIFFALYGLLVVIAVAIILFFNKEYGFREMNPYHHFFLNIFFSLYTHVGNGFFAIGLGLLVLLFKKRRLGALILSSYILSSIIAQALKNIVFELRPGSSPLLSDYKFFITDVTLRGSSASFPSGHSATAFAIASVLAFYFTDKRKGLLFLFLAFLVGYSRIYTGNHFMVDVLAGSFIGLISGIISWLALYKRTWLA
jgi:membrane-associated phospholipid phosphatase